MYGAVPVNEDGSDDYQLIDNYLLVKAARYLGIPPWKLAKKSSFWKNLALCCALAEEKFEDFKRSQNPF